MSRIFFWQAGTDGSSFYRQSLPSLGLQWRGYTATASTQISLGQALAMDAIVGARVAMPSAVAVWERLAQEGVTLLLDMDDDYFNLDKSNVLAYEFWSDPGLIKGLERTMELATTVVAVSNTLADRLREHTDTPVVVIPNGLPAQYLSAPRTFYRPGPVVLGWAGSSSTLHELPLAVHGIRKVLDSYNGQVTLKLVGITLEEAKSKGLTGPHITATGWVPEVPKYLRECMDFDLWLAPYRPTPYNQAKFPTKALEAGMLGIPLLSSDITPYREWVMEKGSECGVQLVTNDHQWSRYIRQFVQDPALRQQFGLEASAAASGHVLQSLAGTWEQVIKDSIRTNKKEAR